MENTKVFIKLESPKDRDDFFEAVALYIMENFERSLAIKHKVCLLAEYPELTAKEEAVERRYISRAAESITSFFLREIYQDELSTIIANIVREEVQRDNAIALKNKDASAAICNRKEMPKIQWQIFPKDVAQLVNAGIALSKKKGIALKEFFKSKDHGKEMIISLYAKPDAFALETTMQISEFFDLKISESLFMDVLADSHDLDKLQKYIKVKKILPDRQKIAIGGAIVAIESAMEIFGASEPQEKKLIKLKERLEEIKKQ